MGPISIARMSATIIKRTLSKGTIPEEVLNEQIARIDQQLEEAVLDIRALQIWESRSAAMAAPATILQLGLGLMAAPLALHNIKVELVDNEVLEPEEVRQQPMLYAWLGLLCHFHDELSTPVTLTVAQTLPHTIRIEIKHMPDDGQSYRPDIKTTHTRIDQAALEALAEAGGFAFTFAPESVSFCWT